MQRDVHLVLILHFFLLFGYFGVSDSDTNSDVRLPLANFPPGSANTGKGDVDINTRTSINKLRMKRTTEIDHHDEEMRLWDQIFANALANSNTTQWIHLREIFDRVEEELHKTKSSGNGSFQHLNLDGMILSNSQTQPLVGPLPKKHLKFSYHRVTGPLRGRVAGRPFAAVTIAVEENKGNADHASGEGKLESDQDLKHESLSRVDFKNFDHSKSKSHHFPNFENENENEEEMGVSQNINGENFFPDSSAFNSGREEEERTFHLHHLHGKRRHHHHTKNGHSHSHHHHLQEGPEKKAFHHHEQKHQKGPREKRKRSRKHHHQEYHHEYQHQS